MVAKKQIYNVIAYSALLYFYAGNYTKSEELAQTFKDMTKTDYRHYYSHYYFFLRREATLIMPWACLRIEIYDDLEVHFLTNHLPTLCRI